LMQVHVQLFSIVRDCLPPDAQRGRASLTLAEGATLTDLVRHLGIDRRLGYQVSEVVSKAGWQVIISGRYEADMGRALQDGDEVRIFLPISGG